MIERCVVKACSTYRPFEKTSYLSTMTSTHPTTYYDCSITRVKLLHNQHKLMETYTNMLQHKWNALLLQTIEPQCKPMQQTPTQTKCTTAADCRTPMQANATDIKLCTTRQPPMHHRYIFCTLSCRPLWCYHTWMMPLAASWSSNISGNKQIRICLPVVLLLGITANVILKWRTHIRYSPSPVPDNVSGLCDIVSVAPGLACDPFLSRIRCLQHMKTQCTLWASWLSQLIEHLMTSMQVNTNIMSTSPETDMNILQACQFMLS